MKYKTCIILCGRQHKDAYNNIIQIIEYLNADIFLVYEDDICNYSNHSKLIDKIKVPRYLESINSGVDNQFLKIKMGWNLMEKYENKENFLYDCVVRFRCDINYELNKDIQQKKKKNKVYLNSDYMFYGLRNEVKNCFFLHDLWYQNKYNDEIDDYDTQVEVVRNININNLIETIKNNPKECFNVNDWKKKFFNKLKAFPIPISIHSEKTEYTKNDTLCLLNNLSSSYKNYNDVLKNKEYKLFFYNYKDIKRMFPPELSIIIILLLQNIIPIHSKFIEAKKKYKCT